MTRRPALSSPQRRRLLKLAISSGFAAFWARNVAFAQTAPGYKALVCIYLQGGNDGENTLVRYDDAGYANYAATRAPASGINIAQKDLLPIQPASISTPYGFHPACRPLKSLFDQKRLAVIANMGVLAQPSTKTGLEQQGARRPANLFSHSDQELAMQSADHAGFTRTGWGGRIADKLEAATPDLLFPPLVSVSGLRTFVSGTTSIPLAVPENPYFTLFSSGEGQYQYDVLRDAALREILAQERQNVYDAMAQVLSDEGLRSSSVVFPILKNPNSIVPRFFDGLSSSIANQLKTVATLMEGRAQTQRTRQVFYVHQWGYDTHGGQLAIQGALLKDLASAIEAFDAAVTALGLAQSVTTFTLSDFGRTFKPASSAGTDHGWGNYAFVVGGAVKGGDFYGKPATQALNGPDDLGKEGRWIPTTSTEEYGATLASWLGLTASDLAFVFPNWPAFGNRVLPFLA